MKPIFESVAGTKIKGGGKMKPILIVEDETIMRESLRDWLTDSGYQVETAEEGEEALKTIAKQDFGIVILDLRLLGKDGIATIKEGAVDYLPIPFDLNDLQKLVQKTLGPVHVEIKPKAAVEKAEVEEVITIARKEIPARLRQGKAYFEVGRYTEALKEFQAILAVAPGSIETRVWIRKTKQKLAEPKIEAVAEGEAAPVAEEIKPKECVWMKMGMVSYRICTRNYDCLTCEFDQEMQEKMAKGEAPELDQALERFKELPGSQRLCRYAIKGDVSYRLCTRLFQCVTCEFGQVMEDTLQQKLVKLQARREALLKKEQKAKV